MASPEDGELPRPPARLRGVAISCWCLFDNIANSLFLKSKPDDTGAQPDFLLYDYGRFKIWCGNLGVRQGGHASLDWRLRDAETMKSTIHGMLNDLEDDLQQCKIRRHECEAASNKE